MPAKRAVLIGCNYPGTRNELRGCVNDVWSMKAILEEFYGFTPANITVLIDTDPQYKKPTGKRMKAHIKKMVEAATDGDTCVLHYSGHGTQIPSYDNEEADGKDEAIVPTDMNLICDDDLRVLLKPLESKPNVKFTFIADCCHSGTLLDHKTVQISGPKKGGPAPPKVDKDALLDALGQPDGRDFKNRELPFNDLCAMLSEMLGGKTVNARNVRSKLRLLFGADSSAKIQHFMGMYEALMGGAKIGDGAGGAAGDVLQMLCQAPPAADQDGPSGTPADANSGPGANCAVPEGNLADPDLKIKLPRAGAKPPSDQRLSEDVGILISGCQANETSADYQPPGHPEKAYGALTNAVQTVVRAHFRQQPGATLTYRNLVIGVRQLLAKTGFDQNPCLECSDKNADSPFIIL